MANDSKYPSFEIADQAVTLADMQISRGYWTYMGKEIRGKGLYKNVNNGQTYLFDAGDIQKIKEKSEMSETRKWPAEWNALVDRVNQDPDIEAFESTGPGGGALSRLRNLKTREEFTVAIPRDAMYRGRAYAFYTPDYTRRTGSKPASGTTVSVSQLIDFFNKSANNEIQENTMKLKNLLQENMTRFGTKNITEQADSNIEQQIVTALYQVIADNQNAQTGIDVIDDMLEQPGEAKSVADSQMMPLVQRLAPIIKYLIKKCDETDYQG